jgi:DNA-binding NarL/FixJ family response regulator
VVAIVQTYGRTDVTQAMALGATAVVASTATSATMVTTVAAAFEGNALVPATVLADLTAAVEPTPCALTDEEIGYLHRLAQGMTVCDLAMAVGRSERDMYRVLSRLWKRMRAIDRTDGPLKAARNGWLDRHPAAVGA